MDINIVVQSVAPIGPQRISSCKDIECSAEGGMYRDGYYIEPQSQRISICKDIECSAAGGMYRDGYYILEIMQMFVKEIS